MSTENDPTDKPLPNPAVRDALYAQFARIGQAVANPTRLHLLALLGQAEKDVETLSTQSGHAFATISAHLKVLRGAHLVETRRAGRHIYYRIAHPDAELLTRGIRDVALRALPEVRELIDTYYDAPETMTTMDAPSLLQAVQRDEVVLIDLRPSDEYAAGHLPEARSVPFLELEPHLDALPADTPIVAYCRGPYCVMGTRGVAQLRAHGLNATRSPLAISDWRAAGLPVVSN